MAPATSQRTPRPRVLVPWWRRPFVRLPAPTAPPLHRLVADLHRLEREAERLLSDETVLARGQKLLAVRTAYDLVLLDACSAVGVPAPRQRAPLTSSERLLTTVELSRAGLAW
ncbi:hypothetical protein [Aquipuribacter sp. SD81]|uniref:hypothetical protein n=1 Tax=Aquipuribacter sp. SD81 TaxID=3127703 RepID=UPI003017871C